jgi:[acyl-carrier-protein] S-malonyltransferase
MKVGLFPGQGIPAAAVLSALPENDDLMAVAHEVLGYDLRRKVEIAARGAKAMLPTSLAQPAIFTAGIVSWNRAEVDPASFDYLAGHSLGEYAALVAGESMPFEAALKAVAIRGDAMHDAAQKVPGGMAAVLGLAFDDATAIAKEAGVVLANDNAPGQVVLSGSDEGLANAAGLIRSQGGRTVLLEVTGPFHTDAMRPAAPALADALAQVDIKKPRIPIISNVTARPYASTEEIRKLLVEQLMKRVRFRESLLWLADQGVNEFEDLGPGRVAAGLAQRTFDSVGKEKEAARA